VNQAHPPREQEQPRRSEPPTPVLAAIRLMYAGAVVSAVSLVMTLATIAPSRQRSITQTPASVPRVCKARRPPL